MTAKCWEKLKKDTDRLEFRTQGGKLTLEEYMNHLWLGISLEDTQKGAKEKSMQGWVRIP